MSLPPLVARAKGVAAELGLTKSCRDEDGRLLHVLAGALVAVVRRWTEAAAIPATTARAGVEATPVPGRLDGPASGCCLPARAR